MPGLVKLILLGIVFIPMSFQVIRSLFNINRTVHSEINVEMTNRQVVEEWYRRGTINRNQFKTMMKIIEKDRDISNL